MHSFSLTDDVYSLFHLQHYLQSSGVARSLLMPGPDEAMDLKLVGGMLPQEKFGICGYRDAFWCNLMAKLYSAEINLNQR